MYPVIAFWSIILLDFLLTDQTKDIFLHNSFLTYYESSIVNQISKRPSC